MTYIVIVINLVLLKASGLYTQPPEWVTSSFIRSASVNVISTITGSDVTPSHSFTFSQAFSGTPNFGYGIKAYQGHDFFGQERFQVNRTFLDQTRFTVSVQIVGVTNIQLMNVAYIAIDPQFPHHLNSFDNVPVNYSNGQIVNISTASNITQYYSNTINYTMQSSANTHKSFLQPYERNKVLLFLTSLFIFGSNQGNSPVKYPIDFRVDVQVVSAEEYKINVSLSINVKIVKLHFSIIVFDQTEVTSSGAYMLVYKKVQLPYTGGFIPIPAEFVTNFIMGLFYFSANQTQSVLDFQWDFATVNGVFGVLMPMSIANSSTGGTNTISTITYTIFYIKTWICSNETFFDPDQDLCTQCPISNCLSCLNLTACSLCNETNNYFQDPVTYECSICNINYCNKCTNLTHCQVCQQQNGFSSVDGVCSCNSSLDMFVNATSNRCEACSIQNCLQCTNLTVCAECDTNNSYYLSTHHDSCQYCNSSENMFINTTTRNCEICALEGCIQCSSLERCLVCNTTSNHYLIGQICKQSICGNGIVEIGQSCDDGNTANQDGCSEFCQFENIFGCSSRNTRCLSSIFVRQSTFQLQKTQCNSFALEFQTKIPVQAVQSAEFVNTDIQSLQHKVLQNNKISISASYSRDIQQQDIQLILTISTPASTQTYIPISLRFAYNGSIPLLHYDADQCKFEQSIQPLMVGVTVFGYALLLFSMISLKIVGLQLFGVFQLSYFSLAFLDYQDLYLQPFKFMRNFNGLNSLATDSPQPSSMALPENISVLGITSGSFLSNFNIMLILFLGQLVVSLILYCVSKLLSLVKLHSIARHMLKQGFVTLLMFNAFNISFSAGLHLRFGQNSDGSSPFHSISTAVLFLVVTLCLSAVLAMQFSQQKQYGEYKNKFKRNPLCRTYIAISILYRMSIGFYISLQSDYLQATILILVLTLTFIMYNLTNLPYTSPVQNYRTNLIHFTQLVNLVVINYYRSMKHNTPISVKGRIHTPVFVLIGMIVLCVVVSVLGIGWELYALVRRFRAGRVLRRDKVGVGVGDTLADDRNKVGVKHMNMEMNQSQNYFPTQE